MFVNEIGSTHGEFSKIVIIITIRMIANSLSAFLISGCYKLIFTFMSSMIKNTLSELGGSEVSTN